MAAPASEDVPLPRVDLVARWVDGELVLLDRDQGRLHHLNATASFVWTELALTRNRAELARTVAREYGVELDVAQNDVTAIVDQFVVLGLLEERAANAPVAGE